MSEDHQHESPIKTWQQLVVVVVLAFVVPITLIGFLVAYVTGGKKIDEQGLAIKPESVAERIRPVAAVNLKDASAPKVFLTGEQVYQQFCKACHEAGVANAPKMGDKTAWAPLIKEGLATILADAIKGVRGMPARGGNPDLSDYEMERAVVYMANAAGAGFKEPAAPAAPVAAKEAPPAAPAATAVSIPAPAPVAVAAAAPAGAAGVPGKALYESACMACHAAGVANAPKLGDKAAWAPRLTTGKEALYAAVIKGKGAMPPKGAAMTSSDADIKAAVDFMLASVK